MKTKFVSVILAVVFITFSCNKVDDLLTFEFDQKVSTTIPAVANIPEFPVSIPIPSIETNSSETFENNNTKAEYVKEIKLKRMSMTITAPENQTFSFLEEIHIFISTNEDNKIELAWATDIPQDAKKITLSTTDKNLDTYVKSDTYDLDIKATVREVFFEDVDLDVDMTFQVTADPL